MQESMDRVFEIVAVVVEVLGAGILLGLEVLVAADLVRTITSKPSATRVSAAFRARASSVPVPNRVTLASPLAALIS